MAGGNGFLSGLGPAPQVAVLHLSGVIAASRRGGGALNIATLDRLIARAFGFRRLRAVALAVNSPGGSPVQSALITRRIRGLAEEKKVPVIGFVEDVAASGGYWLACAGDEIIADESSIVGSVGAVMSGFGFPELIRRHGIERRVQTAGDRKVILDPFQPEKPEDVARINDMLRDIHETFKGWVRERRGDRLKGDEATLFSGEVWTGREAVKLGLIDGIGDVRSVMRERYGKRVRLRHVAPRRGFRLRLASGTGGAIGPDTVAEMLAALDDWALWKRYGL